MAYSGNGTGIQTDPYQVTTIEQLIECFDIYNKIDMGGFIHVYCKLMNDLDFNNSPQYWDCPSSLFYANNNVYYGMDDGHIIYIDGNGFGIYNLYCFNKAHIFNFHMSNKSITNQIIMSNLTLEAIMIKSSNSDRCSLFASSNSVSYYNSGIRVNNCDLRIKYYDYALHNDDEFLLGTNTQFTNCILNIDIVLNTQGYSKYYGNLLTNSEDISSGNRFRNFYNEWKIRVIMVSEPSSDYNNYSMFDRTAHLFSSFFIELIAMKGNSWKIHTSYGSNRMSIVNCYFVIKNIMTSSSYKATPIIYVAKNGVNFYDATIADNIVDSSAGGGSLLALTTAQCKDAEYLEQQGFIIAK
jgi:hypothetical protein